MPGAGAELAARLDLAPLGNVPTQAWSVLVIDLADLVDAEAADFAPSAEPPTTATAARSTSPAAWPTSAARATWAARPAPATGTITAATEWPVTLRSAAKSGARRFTFRTTPNWAVNPLSWSVIAHRILSCSLSVYFLL
jgi:hypothetical protein